MVTYATIETRTSDDHLVVRLSGRGGLHPTRAGRAAQGLTQRLREELAALAGVTRVEVVAARSDQPKCNIVVGWVQGADPAEVGRQAWDSIQRVLADVELRRAYWQSQNTKHQSAGEFE